MKIKARLKGQQLVVKIRFPSNEELNTRELENLVQRNIRGFLKPTIVKKSMIEYIGPPAITLKEYLQSGLSSYDFYHVIAQITDIYRKSEKNNLFINNVILTNQYVYVNPSTREVLFLYAPRLSNHLALDLRSFLNEVAYLTNIDRPEDYHCIPNFYNFLTQTTHFSVNAVEEYLSQQNSQIAAFIRKNIAGSGYMSGRIEKELANQVLYKQDHQTEVKARYSPVGDDTSTRVLDEPTFDGGYASTMPLDQIDYDSEATMLLDDSENTTIQPFLIRSKTQEKIMVNKPVFRIGKERSSVDYCVTDNRAVSRTHADIITRQGHYYVFDQASLNKTFVNNVAIPVKQETEIQNGDEIKLGNECFTFYLYE